MISLQSTPFRRDIVLRLWNIRARKMLVRSEYYYETERAALSADEQGADTFVVSGQHGIDSFPFISVSRIRYLIRKICLLASASHALSCAQASYGGAGPRELCDPSPQKWCLQVLQSTRLSTL